MSNVKLFADDTSLFSVVHDVNTSSTNLSNDFRKISDWAIQWKMSFNPDLSKQLKKSYFPENVRIQIMIQYTLIIILLIKSPLKNILECI